MPILKTTSLKQSSLQLSQKIIDRNSEDNAVIDFEQHIQQLSDKEDEQSIDEFISLYKNLIKNVEQNLWKNTITDKKLGQYTTIFRALEKIQQLKSDDRRFDFKIIIPVADRPQHLEQCLDSLLTLCHNYEYGLTDGKFSKLSVLIADDSKQDINISQHQALCKRFDDKGIKTEYFGLQEQLSLVKKYLVEHQDSRLKQIISDAEHIDDTEHFSHKGASVMRNITYLKLIEDVNDNRIGAQTLFYFIDSDQEFCINSHTSDDKYYAINYFHYLDEIFQTQDVELLTGKVVGDPPVSPSVMANNFQQDVKKFIQSMAALEPGHHCQFHRQLNAQADDAAYHDMANLFGFDNRGKTFEFHCTLKGEHSNADCFSDFSDKLEHFFFGEHPTRKTFFNYEQGFTRTSPARTVYTGNYVIRADALQHFIPFATLKLRMAGPVLGRILKSKLEHRFVSANLPMLHNRTIESTGQSEFRPGVENEAHKINLGSEFIRQFYGDVMLFSIEQLTDIGYPHADISREITRSIIGSTCNRILESYIDKHDTILQLKRQISELLDDSDSWWHRQPSPATDLALGNFRTFLNNIENNFANDAQAYQQITSDQSSQRMQETLLQAIMDHKKDVIAWQRAVFQA
ncbi:MAG: hypothetical protein IMF14_02720 [Proteobacteria bacterium]|nr:hypothetical protein [Pseudomonadota bacterium]